MRCSGHLPQMFLSETVEVPVDRYVFPLRTDIGNTFSRT